MTSVRRSVVLKQLIDWFAYILVRCLVCLAQAMSIERCHEVCRVLAWLASDVVRIRKAVVDDNLRHAFPAWTETQRRMCARKMWEHLFLMTCEIAHIQRKLHTTNYRQFLMFHQKPISMKYLLEGRPLVQLTAHYGNFEVFGFIIGMMGMPSYTVARPLDNRYLDRWLKRFRQGTGQTILPKDGSAKTIDAVLEAGGRMSLLGDQHAGPKGCWVDFFGRPASCHKAVAVFTLVSGAPQLVVALRRLGKPMRFDAACFGVVDPRDQTHEAMANVKSLTKWYNQRLEEMIRECPEQYWWVHRRWKGTPPRRSLPSKAA